MVKNNKSRFVIEVSIETSLAVAQTLTGSSCRGRRGAFYFQVKIVAALQDIFHIKCSWPGN